MGNASQHEDGMMSRGNYDSHLQSLVFQDKSSEYQRRLADIHTPIHIPSKPIPDIILSSTSSWIHSPPSPIISAPAPSPTSAMDLDSLRKLADLTLTSNEIAMTCMHVSCKSDKIEPGVNYLGMVLYGYDGKTDWRLGGIHCRTGYVYIRKASALEGIEVKKRQTAHNRLYKSLFGVEVDYSKKIVGAGFAIQDGVRKYRSSTFNDKDDDWHDHTRTMSPEEIKCIDAALDTWDRSNGKTQNTLVKDIFDKKETVGIAKEDPVTVDIVGLNGPTSITIDKSELVRDLKIRYCAKVGGDPLKMTFIQCGKKLNEFSSVGDCGISDGMPIHVAFRC